MDPSTASRVLRRDWVDVIKPETRQRIFDAASELGYRPNALARSLRTRHSHTLGLIVPDIANFAWASIASGIHEAADRLGYLVVLADARSSSSEATMLERLALENRVDGLLVAFATRDDPLVAKVAASTDIPIVAVNRRVAGLSGAVYCDDRAGADLAVRYLYEHEHRHIAHVSGPDSLDTALRRSQGFREAVATLDLPFDERWQVDGHHDEEGGYRAMRQLATLPSADRPTAVFVDNLLSCLGALRALRELGSAVPDDMSVVAMDEHIVAAHTWPPLTTIEMPWSAMGDAAVAMLVAAIEDEAQVSHHLVAQAPRVVARASVRSLSPVPVA